MGNPQSTRQERGPCKTCGSYGGVYEPEARFGSTICNNSTQSGKRVCRMPEDGCCFWVKAITQRPISNP